MPPLLLLMLPVLLAGVLLCACTDAARKQLSKDFAAATDMGAAAVTAQSGVTACGDAAQRPLGKQYRALVTGILERDEVRWWTGHGFI